MIPFVAAGCMTLRRSKDLVITPEPGTTKIVVSGEATARCFNLILVTVCRMGLEMHESYAQKAEPPALSTRAAP